MKKNKLILVCLILIITICGCKRKSSDGIEVKEKDNIASTTSESDFKSISDLNGKELSDVISIEDNCTALAINTNDEFEMNHSISVYGKFLISDEAEELKTKIGEKINKVSLYSNDDIIVSAQRMTWNFMKADQGIEFVLNIPVEKDCNYSDTIEVTSITFDTPTESFDKELGTYYLMPYSDVDNKVRVVESPSAPRVIADKESRYAYSYVVLTANPEFNKDFKANIILPEKCKKYVEVNSIEIEKNSEMAKELKETLKGDLTLQQKKDLKVYSINVIYHFIKGERVILQPLIELDITGEKQIIAPFCALDQQLSEE